jgi:tRNA pseudouridine55 synthase
MITGFDANTDFSEGAILLIDKPLDWSSFDVVKKVRNVICRKFKINKIKVGHAGTLDPLATGLMIICTGRATKQIESYQEMEKEYVATIKLGESTPSFDLETDPDQSYPTEHITRELVITTLETFTGESMQVPPVFSAKRFKGKRAYDFAREGRELKMKPQHIDIYEIENLNYDRPELIIRIRCSKGTYIRSLARDIGVALDTGAHLTALRRTHIGDYSVDDALSPERFAETLNNL